MISPASLLQHELIGLETKVICSPNPNQVGIQGKVLDETQKTLIILHNNKEKRIIKENVVLLFMLPDKSIVKVDGRVLICRPEDRVKKKIWRHW